MLSWFFALQPFSFAMAARSVVDLIMSNAVASVLLFKDTTFEMTIQDYTIYLKG